MCRPLVLCRKQSARRERPSRSMSSLHSWWSAAKGRRRCRVQRRQSRQHSLTPQRVTRSGSRQGIASRTTTCRPTFFGTERRLCLVQRRRDDCPMCRPLVLCRKQSARREPPSRSKSPHYSWSSSPKGRRRCRVQRRRTHRWSVRSQRVTRSRTLQGIASRTIQTLIDTWTRARGRCPAQRGGQVLRACCCSQAHRL